MQRFFGDPTPIQKDYAVSNFRSDVGALPVCKSVHLQVGVAPGDELGEAGWLCAQARNEGLPTGIVAFADLTAPTPSAQLDHYSEIGEFRGIRQIVGRSPEEDWETGSAGLLDDHAFLCGLTCLANRGLLIGLQLIPARMDRAAALLRKVEKLSVAICHAGSLSSFSTDNFRNWQMGMAKLAQLPRAVYKFSGFGMYNKAWTAETAAAQFRVVLDLFGPDRLAFGSNFPVDGLAATSGQVWSRFSCIAEGLFPTESDQVHAGTAENFYRI